MPNKMLIDTSHPEETRVVVVRGNRIEEFDFESQHKKQLKGNIYLARVTRVEPSLQAAFVEYGGNRHGFLAFSEIHPDYYQIPVADRQALLNAEAEDHDDEDDEDSEERSRSSNRRRRRGGRSRDRSDEGARAAEASESPPDAVSAGDVGEDASLPDLEDANGHEPAEQNPTSEAAPAGDLSENADEAAQTVAVSEETDAGTPQVEADSADATPIDTTADDAATVEEQAQPEAAGEDDHEENTEGGPTSIAAEVELDVISEKIPAPADEDGSDNGNGVVEDVHHANHDDHDNEVVSIGSEDALEEIRDRRKPSRRHYKIQEVIKRRQILLVQVVKEERGNKGAALTTYLSLAGRYSVLMPNTARGGGISRKITNVQDRKRLKEVVADLAVPQGMGVILRTAGESRTKAEIKRDYEYLMRLWDNVRELTLSSSAPSLVYEEGSLIKRSVRDLYNKDIDQILVAGEDGYREAKDFMRMLMPSHAKVVQPYRETTPLFARFGIEAQLDRMLQPQVTLKSGGYLIINQTEALVSIDVNSGRSTKEHSIEETALHTNLEAAEEVARQLRLRDLAGLIVIDFIDMEENRNNRAVEKKLKDCLKNDRARIQLGRISHFGLMEMSRQRIRASVLESTTKPCPHCGGTGHLRSDSSVALLVVRAIEEFLLKDPRHHITVKTPASTALYVLNHKRSTLTELEARFGLSITIDVDETVGTQHYAIQRGAEAERPQGVPVQHILPPPLEDDDEDEPVIASDEEDGIAAEQDSSEQRQAENGDENGRRKRRRRRRRGGRDRDQAGMSAEGEAGPATQAATAGDSENDGDDDHAVEAEAVTAEAVAVDAETSEDDAAKKRRRGKRGGRRNRKDGETGTAEAGDVSVESNEAVPAVVADATETTEEAPEATPPAESVADAPSGTGAAMADDVAANDTVAPVANEEAKPVKKPSRPRRAPRSKKAAAAEEANASEVQEPVAATQPDAVPASEAVGEPGEEATQAPAAEAKAAETPPTAEDSAPAEVPAPVRASRRKAAREEPAAEPVVSSTLSTNQEEETTDQQPKRNGWWQRRGFF